jgi:hypothetical protein
LCDKFTDKKVIKILTVTEEYLYYVQNIIALPTNRILVGMKKLDFKMAENA